MIRSQVGIGGRPGTGDDEALALSPTEAADVNPELVHVRDEREGRLDKGITVAVLPGRLKIVKALVHGGAIVLLTELAGIEAGTNVLELAKNLGDAITTRSETAKGQISEPRSTRLAGAGHFELRAAGIDVVGLCVSLQAVAPGFDKKALDEGGFRCAFGQLFARGPGAQASQQGIGFGTVLERQEFGVPLGP